jgi:hypothetical protein
MAWRINAKGMAKRANREFGKWLSLPEWEWFVTLTFKERYVSRGRADHAWYVWFDTLRLTAVSSGQSECRYGVGSPYYFRSVEYQERGTLHFHALVGGVGDVRRLDFKDWWEPYGFARVLKYDPGRGANFYVGKYLTKDDGDIRFSNNLKHYLTLT